MSPADGKPEPSSTDPEQLARLLEIELMQKRATWQRTSEQRKSVRMLAFLFLLVVIAGAFAAYFFLFANGLPPRDQQQQSPAADRSQP
jgi:flagellar basal body-associated protein FliL